MIVKQIYKKYKYSFPVRHKFYLPGKGGFGEKDEVWNRWDIDDRRHADLG